MSKIKDIKAREILDSRGNPTIEVDVILTNGVLGRASSPSGASVGKKEALELRDHEPHRYSGMGVHKAIESVEALFPEIKGQSVNDHYKIDEILIAADGSKNKNKFGANAILALSMACAKAGAISKNIPLYEFMMINPEIVHLPVPMMNVINGGVHADNDIDIQEFMIAPVTAPTFAEALRVGSEVFHSLKNILSARNLGINVGDEGGFAPQFRTTEEAIELILSAIEISGYVPGDDVLLALDVAASELFDNDIYHLRGISKKMDADEIIDYYEKLVANYPIYSIEDPIDENDFIGWQKITNNLGKKIQLVGDDVFATNTEILRCGIAENIANAILIKPNQVGTLKETCDTINLARKNSYNCIMSHRSGETEDVSIAHLAVAHQCTQIKAGSLSRTDRLAKYNELIRIEEYCGSKARFLGQNILKK